MNMQKKARVEAIRANTAYPAYRSIIGIITVILMILAALQGIGAIILGSSLGALAHNGFAGFAAILIGLGFAALAFFLAKIWNEAAQILVDIGDSVLDANPTLSPSPGLAPVAASLPITPPFSAGGQ